MTIRSQLAAAQTDTDALRPQDYNGSHVPDVAETPPAERIAAATENVADMMLALEQVARDALARLDAILAKMTEKS